MTATMQDAATTVRLLLEAFLAGDIKKFMSYIDDDLEWNPAPHHPLLTHQYRGREQFLNGAVAKVAAELDGLRFDIDEVYACGNVAVTEMYCHATSRTTDVPSTCTRPPFGRFVTAKWCALRSIWIPGQP